MAHVARESKGAHYICTVDDDLFLSLSLRVPEILQCDFSYSVPLATVLLRLPSLFLLPLLSLLPLPPPPLFYPLIKTRRDETHVFAEVATIKNFRYLSSGRKNYLRATLKIVQCVSIF